MPRGIDPGFGHNVGMVDPVQQARDTLNQKITTAPESAAPCQRHAGVTGLSLSPTWAGSLNTILPARNESF